MIRFIKSIFRKKDYIFIENNKVDIKKMRMVAEDYYLDRKFYCSEAVLKTLKDGFEAPYGDEIIKLSSGFPVGMGNGCACGAINGGVMAIGMFFSGEKAMELTKELQEKFLEKRKVCCCKVLTRGMKLGSKVHLKHCVTITGELTELTAKILARELGYEEK